MYAYPYIWVGCRFISKEPNPKLDGLTFTMFSRYAQTPVFLRPACSIFKIYRYIPTETRRVHIVYNYNITRRGLNVCAVRVIYTTHACGLFIGLLGLKAVSAWVGL